MSDMKQSFFTRVLNPIKDNKYFNAKDAMFVGTTAAGALVEGAALGVLAPAIVAKTALSGGGNG